jgi:hypothetical protein
MHAPNVPEVECRVSNVIALFGLKVGARRAAMGMTQQRVLVILRGEFLSGRSSSRVGQGPARGVEAARRRKRLGGADGGRNRASDGGDGVMAGQIRAVRETPRAKREIAL